ncbi:MAG: pitrilysin family protein [Chloroflexota bacterium]|nr:pitrilysin family protein [Chloroflexota bacterium]
MHERSILSNGLRVLTSAMPHTRSVSVGVFVGAGSRYEHDAIAGASHFLEHMLFKGSPKRPQPQLISGAIEGVGGVINASTDREVTTYWTKTPANHFGLAMDVLADMVRRPLLPPDEYERERGVILEELAMTYDQPDAYADLLIDQTLWPDQPMGRDIGGTPESVRAMPLAAVAEYHARQYIPANAVVAVAGNVTHEQAVAEAEALLGDWAGGDPLAPYRVEASAPGARVVIAQKRTNQAHVALALEGVPGDDPARYAVDILSTALGDGMTSRLFVELRERQGLVYEIFSCASHYRDCGALSVYFGSDPKKVDDAIGAVLSELDRLRQGLDAEELRRVVEYSTGRMMLRLEDTRSAMAWLGAQELLHGETRTPEEVAAEVRALTPDDIRRAAERCLLPNACKLAVVGPYRSQARFQRLLAA